MAIMPVARLRVRAVCRCANVGLHDDSQAAQPRSSSRRSRPGKDLNDGKRQDIDAEFVIRDPNGYVLVLAERDGQ
jgi:hypothetical protein